VRLHINPATIREGQSGYVIKGKGAPVYRISHPRKGKAPTRQGFSSTNPW